MITLTFNGLVKYGRRHGANIVAGMPWSFKVGEISVTHENNECYIVGLYQMTQGDLLVVDKDEYIVMKDVGYKEAESIRFNWTAEFYKLSFTDKVGKIREVLSAETIPVDWQMETKDPVAEMDRIFEEYSKTFGRTPDAEMAKTVRKVEMMLLGWWGWHRETIREALVAHLDDGK